MYIHFTSDTYQNRIEDLSVCHTKLLYCPNPMLPVIVLSQHWVSPFKLVRPRAPCGARCMRHTVRTWSAVYLVAPQLQFGEGTRTHLCMDEWNRPTPVCRQLNLTQAVWDKLIPIGLALVMDMKA